MNELISGIIFGAIVASAIWYVVFKYSNKNKIDLEKVTALFSISAVIDDPSTGKTFRNESGIRRYIADYFVSYRTISKIIEIEGITPDRAVARVNFTGSFGHEIGTLDVILSRGGLINRYLPLTNYTYQKINF